MEFDEYQTIKDCKYHRAFPSMNSNSLLVLCTRNVNEETLKLPPSKYASTCTNCIGTACQKKEHEP